MFGTISRESLDKVRKQKNKQFWLKGLLTSEQYCSEIPVFYGGNNQNPKDQEEGEAAEKDSCNFCRKRSFVKTRGTYESRERKK